MLNAGFDRRILVYPDTDNEDVFDFTIDRIRVRPGPMLVTFKTKSYANITMFGDVGKQMLEFMDFGTSVPGGIVAADVAIALSNLQRRLKTIPDTIDTVREPDDDQPAVSLHTRAIPLIELLKSAIADDNDVRWE